MVLRLWTSLLFCSSSSCIPTRTWRCLSFRSSTECSNLQLCFRGVYAQCKLCKSWSFHRAVLRRCVRALCCVLTVAGDGPDSAENREVSARVLGQGCLARCDARQGVVQTVQKTVKIPHAFLDMVLARRCCNDRCRMVETVQKNSWSLRSWCCSWTRFLTCPCWPRHGGCRGFCSCSSSTGVSAHHGHDELMRRLFFGPCTQVHGQG